MARPCRFQLVGVYCKCCGLSGLHRVNWGGVSPSCRMAELDASHGTWTVYLSCTCTEASIYYTACNPYAGSYLCKTLLWASTLVGLTRNLQLRAWALPYEARPSTSRAPPFVGSKVPAGERGPSKLDSASARVRVRLAEPYDWGDHQVRQA